MRKIKFRGKTISTAEWVYGSVVVYDNGAVVMSSSVDGWYERRYVEPDTVGQYTGMDDDDGEEIYEGDTEPILDYLAKVEKSIIWYFIDIRGLCRERAEIIVGNAVNKYLDKLKEGVSSFAIYNTVKRYALGENNRLARESEITDLIRKRATISAC